VIGPGRSRRWRLLFWRKVETPIEDEANLLAAFDAAPFGQQADALGRSSISPSRASVPSLS
jgi:hypothetical protein